MGRKKKLINNSGIPQHEIEHMPGASSLIFSPTTKARKASGSSGNGRLSAKRDRRKERKGNSKQVTEQGAVNLAAPFLV